MQGIMRGIPGEERVHLQIGRKRLECRVIADRWWFDTEPIQTTDSSKKFFLSLAGKTPDQANFEGDKSLVKEEEFALIYGAVAYMISVAATKGLPLFADVNAIFHSAAYEWKQNNTVVSEDNMLVLAGGVSLRVSGTPIAVVGEYQPGDGRHDNMRKFTKPILVTGGRSLDFETTFTQAVAVDDTIALMIRFYGLHLIPSRLVPSRAEVEATAAEAGVTTETARKEIAQRSIKEARARIPRAARRMRPPRRTIGENDYEDEF